MLFQTPTLTAQDINVIGRIIELRQHLKHHIGVTRRWTGMLRRTSLAKAIRGSNSIEGYNVSQDDAVAAVEGEEPLDANTETWMAILGYRDAMTYVLQLADDPHFSYGANLFRGLHYVMTKHDLSKNPGKWRPGPVFVNDEEAGERVYEAPDAELVPGLIDELVRWLQTAETDCPAIVRAAMAHLNYVMVHPHSDGNGRMARCLQTAVLAREGVLEPVFCSIEEYLGHNTKDYYAVLAEVGAGSWHPERDAAPWLRYVLVAHYRQARTLLTRVRENHVVWDRLEREVTGHGLPERMTCALFDASYGYRVRNATYRNAADVSENTATRDLKVLADNGLLVANGHKRGRFYTAAPAVIEIRRASRQPRRVEDPFLEPSPSSISQLQLFGQ